MIIKNDKYKIKYYSNDDNDNQYIILTSDITQLWGEYKILATYNKKTNKIIWGDNMIITIRSSIIKLKDIAKVTHNTEYKNIIRENIKVSVEQFYNFVEFIYEKLNMKHIIYDDNDDYIKCILLSDIVKTIHQ